VHRGNEPEQRSGFVKDAVFRRGGSLLSAAAAAELVRGLEARGSKASECGRRGTEVPLAKGSCLQAEAGISRFFFKKTGKIFDKGPALKKAGNFSLRARKFFLTFSTARDKVLKVILWDFITNLGGVRYAH